MDSLSYRDAGVDYRLLDPFKVACQRAAEGTMDALGEHGFQKVPGARGESAFLIETPDAYLAHVEEALGTKNLVADALYRLTGESHYRHVAVDNVSTIVNDLCTCGARPVSLCMYLAVGDASYLADGTRADDLAAGFAEGCRQAGAIWAGGETQVLKGIVQENAAVLGGSALGRISPKERRIRADLEDGDAIILLASSGVQTNGITLCRAVADRLPEGYLTELSDGRTFGEALLSPSVIYARFIAACQQQGIYLHYAVHLTGHGWRKLMRPPQPFVYRIDSVPEPQPVFRCVTEAARMDDCEAYGTFNMGAGFAVYVRPEDVERCLECAGAAGHRAWQAGTVQKEGERKAVVIEPLGVTYDADSLRIR